MPFHVMLIPTLNCPAHCVYCWSSEKGSPIMTIDTIKETVAWLKDFRDDAVTFTFHGGEPLMAGPEFYKEALPLLATGLGDRKVAFAMQSNLWLMTPKMAKILAEYDIPIGSSIDGPEDLNDSQRGVGYYKKTMKGYKIAKDNGVNVRFICTFTSDSVKRKEEIFNYFLQNGFTLKLHPAMPSLRNDKPEQWALDPKEYGELLVYLLDKYLENIGSIDVMNIDTLCKGVFTRRGSVCTFVDCMGDTFAIGPDGSIYPCYRFVGMEKYAMGNVYDRPSMKDLAESYAGKLMFTYKDYVDNSCKKCAHIKYCRGGCPYNAIVPNDGKIKGVDPDCIAYKRIFGEITDRFNSEMFGSSSMESTAFGLEPMGKQGIMSIMLKKI